MLQQVTTLCMPTKRDIVPASSWSIAISQLCPSEYALNLHITLKNNSQHKLQGVTRSYFLRYSDIFGHDCAEMECLQRGRLCEAELLTVFILRKNIKFLQNPPNEFLRHQMSEHVPAYDDTDDKYRSASCFGSTFCTLANSRRACT